MTRGGGQKNQKPAYVIHGCSLIINGHGLKFHPKDALVVLPKTHLSCNLKKMRLGEVFCPFLKRSLDEAKGQKETQD